MLFLPASHNTAFSATVKMSQKIVWFPDYIFNKPYGKVCGCHAADSKISPTSLVHSHMLYQINASTPILTNVYPST